MQTILNQFKDWVAKQPPEQAYNFDNIFTCALAQYGQSLGLANAKGGNTFFVPELGGTPVHILPDGNTAIWSGEWTFGALAKRLDNLAYYQDQAPEHPGGFHGYQRDWIGEMLSSIMSAQQSRSNDDYRGLTVTYRDVTNDELV